MLSSLAKDILNNPNKLLSFNHGAKKTVESGRIYDALSLSSVCSKPAYAKALKSIRELASRRGIHPEKALVHKSILKYAKTSYRDYKTLHALNSHIKGLYGCELPTKYRQEIHSLFRSKRNVEVVPVNNVQEIQHPMSEVSLNIEGLSFTLSKGSSLTIGELKTRTLDFKGLKSVKVEKIENGSLYGVCLET